MKLETSIALRNDGTVLWQGLDKTRLVFKPDENGMVVCDVAHEETVAYLLRTGQFFPVDEADHQQASALVSQIAGDSEVNDDDHDDGEDEDDEVDPNALPIESSTPPASFKQAATPRRKAAAKAQ